MNKKRSKRSFWIFYLQLKYVLSKFFMLRYIINKMSQFDFDHELYFINDFNDAIILQSDVPDKSETFKNVIRDEIQKIKSILQLHGGVHKLSTFVEYDSLRYKTTLEKVE